MRQYKIYKIKLQLLKEKNKKTLDKINKIKNTLRRYNEPKPKKKKIADVIKFPKINII